MIISFHIGAHCTNGAKLGRGLWKNREILEQNGIIVPKPAGYREILPQAMKRVKHQSASAEIEELVLDHIIETDECARIVMSYEDAISMPQYAFRNDKLYSNANFKLKWLRNVFPSFDVEYHIGIRNPATFIPELCPSPQSYESLIGGTDIEAIRWSNVINDIRESCPDVSLTVFAYEDTPLTWPEVLRTVAGVDASVPLNGELDILATIMQREGMKRLRTYLHSHKPQTASQQQEILARFLETYVDESAIEEEIDLPGWNGALIERLTDQYEDDLMEIENISGVSMILP